MDAPLDPSVLDALRRLDTPTVCNALEVVAPERRGHGYSLVPFFCPRPELEPIVGYARTATIRAMTPPEVTGEDAARHRVAYYRHIEEGPGPSIVVIQDIDDHPGYGAWWGEVNTNVHQGLGALGVITNGSVRDIDDSAEGFQLLAGMPGPSHAWVRVEEFGVPVTVHGMAVEPGDLIHADRHGAVVVPIEVAAAVPGAAADIAAKEQVLISASNEPGFSADRIAAILGLEEGH
ncbi:MAG: RraA family protein [Actinomycetota bacterium]